jgi:hypothetical protein
MKYIIALPELGKWCHSQVPRGYENNNINWHTSCSIYIFQYLPALGKVDTNFSNNGLISPIHLPWASRIKRLHASKSYGLSSICFWAFCSLSLPQSWNRRYFQCLKHGLCNLLQRAMHYVYSIFLQYRIFSWVPVMEPEVSPSQKPATGPYD